MNKAKKRYIRGMKAIRLSIKRGLPLMVFNAQKGWVMTDGSENGACRRNIALDVKEGWAFGRQWLLEYGVEVK